jgi:beta-glucosidase
MATFGTTTDAVLDVVTGAFSPTGKMPFSTPKSRKAVVENQSDVPGYLKKDYALFKFGDGLSY